MSKNLQSALCVLAAFVLCVVVLFVWAMQNARSTHIQVLNKQIEVYKKEILEKSDALVRVQDKLQQEKEMSKNLDRNLRERNQTVVSLTEKLELAENQVKAMLEK